MNINWDFNIDPNNSGLWKMKKQPYHVMRGQEKSAQDDHVAHKTKTVFFKAPRLGLGKKHETKMHTYRTLLKYWNQGVVELMMFLILGSYCINDIYIYYCVDIYIYCCVFPMIRNSMCMCEQLGNHQRFVDSNNPLSYLSCLNGKPTVSDEIM